ETQSKLSIWLAATRPKTLAAGFAPVLIGTALAQHDGTLFWPAAITCFLGAMFIQIGTNFANDYFDFVKGADTDERKGPTRATASGLVKPGTMKLAFSFAFFLAFICTLYLTWHAGLVMLLILLVSIVCGILYTGGPFPLGYNGLGDPFAFIFFGPVATAATYYCQANNFELPVEAIIAGLGPGFFSVAMIGVNNLRDIETDKKAGKRTLAVLLGEKFARVEYLLAIIGGLIIPIIIFSRLNCSPYIFLSYLFLIPCIPSIRLVLKESGSKLNKALALTGAQLIIYSVFLSVGLVL
ncbi:MAG: 1,4-dihydroxy-2-naphthoate polyprenyltransferase, partial [Lentisphaeria bacterium]|nr:1,4-dihydroxy-2-naphthoate polyprenyltransferase [Lentisphaeria bacterium]